MLVLGLDVGTTAVKAVVLDGAGRVVGSGRREYPTAADNRGRSEQDPGDWWRAAVAATRQATENLDAGRIAALSLSTQGSTSCLIGEDGEALAPAITWMDQRALPQRDRLAEEKGEEYFYRRTGWKLHPSLDAAKALWLAEETPGTLAAARGYVSTLEYMNHRLCGRRVIDPTNAAIRQLLNLDSLDWDEEIARLVRLDPAMLPEIAPSGANLGPLLPAAREALGLGGHAVLFNGAHDQYCAALGGGLTRPGQTLIATGTTWVVFSLSDRPAFSPSFIAPGPHVIPGRWGGIASLPGSGAAFDWFMKQCPGEGYADVEKIAATRRDNAAELLFYPYFAGALFPLWRYRARASTLGLGFGHDRYDLALAVLEGVAFHLRLAVEEFRKAGSPVESLRLVGGAAKSALWVDIVAAVLDRPVETSTEADRSCIGAALMAGAGCGLYDSYEPAVAGAGWTRTDPEAGAAAFYRGKSERHAAAWRTLEKCYDD